MYHNKFCFIDNYEANAGGSHFYNEVRRDDEEMPESPNYRGYHHDSYQYGETSMSGSNSCDEDDERDFDGKRSGDPLSGLAAKKRRKQSKPIRLGSEEEGEHHEEAEAVGEGVEEGEIARYRRVSGDSGEGGQSEDSPPSQADAPLNLSAVSKQSDHDKSESGGKKVEILRILFKILFDKINYVKNTVFLMKTYVHFRSKSPWKRAYAKS